MESSWIINIVKGVKGALKKIDFAREEPFTPPVLPSLLANSFQIGIDGMP